MINFLKKLFLVKKHKNLATFSFEVHPDLYKDFVKECWRLGKTPQEIFEAEVNNYLKRPNNIHKD